MVPSVLTAETLSAAADGSLQSDLQVHPSSSSYRCEVIAEVNGGGRTGTAMQIYRSDLNCVGIWADKEEYQRIGAPIDSVQLDVSREGCARHRNIHEACSAPTDHFRIVKLLEKPYISNITDCVGEGQIGQPSVATCTCVVTIEIDNDEVNPPVTGDDEERCGGACEAAEQNVVAQSSSQSSLYHRKEGDGM